ncbi:hypothetical protein D0T60_07115 [Bacteroides sp. 224]|nr:hypothetical protein [Bacteroides sp. 224]
MFMLFYCKMRQSEESKIQMKQNNFYYWFVITVKVQQQWENLSAHNFLQLLFNLTGICSQRFLIIKV